MDVYRLRKYNKNILIFGLILIVVLCVLVVGNYLFCKQNPGGNDFLVHWIGTRALILNGSSPYGDDVAKEIQQIAYGRSALPGEHELRFAYPLYSTIIFTPFALINDFTWARAIWMAVLEIALVALSLLSLKVVKWNPDRTLLIIIMIFSIVWYFGMRALINGNAVILVALGMVCVIYAIRNQMDEICGILLGLITIKPQVVLVFILFIVIWSITHKRWKILGWFMGSMAIFCIGASILVPDWILQNIHEIVIFSSYNPPLTPSEIFAEWWPSFGSRIGIALSSISIVSILLVWRDGVFTDSRDRKFLWIIFFSMAAGQWIGISIDPGNFLVLFPAILFIGKFIIDKWKFQGKVGFLIILGGLFVGLWILFTSTLIRTYQPVQNPIMMFPLPAIILFILLWIRWWVFNIPEKSDL